MVKRINIGKRSIRIVVLPARTATTRNMRRAVVLLIGGLAVCAIHADAQVPQSTQPADAVAQPMTRGPTQAELDQSDVDPGQWLTDNKGYRLSLFESLVLR